MATSLLSLALDKPLDPTIAMTGELTVTGKVLRIGGLREKTVAARRAGAKQIIFPQDNMSDWLELPEVSGTSRSHATQIEALLLPPVAYPCPPQNKETEQALTSSFSRF